MDERFSPAADARGGAARAAARPALRAGGGQQDRPQEPRGAGGGGRAAPASRAWTWWRRDRGAVTCAPRAAWPSATSATCPRSCCPGSTAARRRWPCRRCTRASGCPASRPWRPAPRWWRPTAAPSRRSAAPRRCWWTPPTARALADALSAAVSRSRRGGRARPSRDRAGRALLLEPHRGAHRRRDRAAAGAGLTRGREPGFVGSFGGARGQVHARRPEPGAPARAVQRVRGRSAPARGARARGRRLGNRPAARHRRAGRQRRGHRALGALRAQRAAAAHPRPLRPPDRRGGARPVLALAAAPGRGAGDPLAAVARPALRGARGARLAHVRVEPGERRGHVPRVDDLLGDPGAARGARPRRGVGAAPDQAELRGRRPLRDGDDGEAGRVRRSGQHHRRGAGRRRHLRDHRPQVVLLVSVLRHLPDARPDARRASPAS